MADSAQKLLDDLARQSSPIAASPDQRADLELLRKRLSDLRMAAPGDLPCAIVGGSGDPVPLPESLLVLLTRAVEFMARGDSVNLISTGQELTTQQAADMLNVSRQYLVRLINDGRMPCTKTGTHRRVRVEDVLAFKAQRDREREAGLDDLTRLSEELGGYDELE